MKATPCEVENSNSKDNKRAKVNGKRMMGKKRGTPKLRESKNTRAKTLEKGKLVLVRLLEGQGPKHNTRETRTGRVFS